MPTIRPYRPADDEASVFALWQRCLGEPWPLSREVFHRVTVGTDAYRAGDHLVAEDGGALVGFVATQREEGAQTGHILALLVAPEQRRRGLGRALHDAALAHLRAAAVRQAQLGGGELYLWSGIPANLPDAHAFFAALGWPDAGPSYDLARDVSGFTAPPAAFQRIAAHGVALATATATDATAAEVLAFVARHFSWLGEYQAAVRSGDYDDILYARAANGAVVGSICMYSPQSHPPRLDVRWQTLLGADAGAINAVGVAESARGQGIAHAMTARATEIVRDRGARQCFIGWTARPGLYGDLGYTVWREYQESWREIG